MGAFGPSPWDASNAAIVLTLKIATMFPKPVIYLDSRRYKLPPKRKSLTFSTTPNRIRDNSQTKSTPAD
jgi:hypothetical protein